jgi:hypothetical protein
VETDTTKQMSPLWVIYKVHIDENLALGGRTNPWFLTAPATYDQESLHWDNPDSHKITG